MRTYGAQGLVGTGVSCAATLELLILGNGAQAGGHEGIRRCSDPHQTQAFPVNQDALLSLRPFLSPQLFCFTLFETRPRSRQDGGQDKIVQLVCLLSSPAL
jgi:hypothetical protein